MQLTSSACTLDVSPLHTVVPAGLLIGPQRIQLLSRPQALPLCLCPFALPVPKGHWPSPRHEDSLSTGLPPLAGPSSLKVVPVLPGSGAPTPLCLTEASREKQFPYHSFPHSTRCVPLPCAWHGSGFLEQTRG